MIAWNERPIEIANLLNPAFCSMLIFEAVAGYEEKSVNGMPYPITFLILPMVLHKYTRELIPKTLRTKLHIWLQKNPEVKVQFSERTRQLVPYTKESILFGNQSKTLEFNENGNLTRLAKKIKKDKWPENSESHFCRKKAHFTGRWLAEAGSIESIYIMWGIRP